MYMPELPEVETIRRQLEASVVGKTIKATEVLSSKRLNVSAEVLQKGTVGAKIVAVRRRAKLLMIDLSNNNSIAIHLKMTGRVLVMGKKAPPFKHTFVIFRLSNGDQIMWEDYRRFGYLKIFKTPELEDYVAKQKYGPEPLLPSFGLPIMSACLLKKPRTKIKPLLMDQNCIAGVGNIYAAEALFLARVDPARPAGRLNKKELSDLWKAIRSTMSESIKHRGTSADSYVDAKGEPGTYEKKLKVYGREGEPCLRKDGGRIKKIKLAGRGTFFCPVCQK
jgi:formamidopyrimidine-DNA glycosylase